MWADGEGGLERFCSPGKGRGLRALRPFQVGDLLFSCPAYACVLTGQERGIYLPFLFSRKEGLSKCGRCKQAFYCNVDCQREDWPMHKLECTPMVVFGENWNPSETVRLTARILAKQKIHPERTPSEKLLAVKEFESHLDKLDNEKKDLIQSDIAALHHFYSKHLEFPDTESLVVLFAQVNCNGFTIEDEELSHVGSAIFPEDKQEGLWFLKTKGNGARKVHQPPQQLHVWMCVPTGVRAPVSGSFNWGKNPFGLKSCQHCDFKGSIFRDQALFPSPSLFSCQPSGVWGAWLADGFSSPSVQSDVRLIVWDGQQVPSQPVFTSYIDLLYPTEDRNDRLRDSYFFTCECQECTTKDKDNAKVEIRKLTDPPKAEAIRDMVRYARNVIEEFRRAKHYKSPSELLEMCALSQEKMSSVFEDSNVYMLHMMYQAMGVCLYMQDWEGALRYGQKIIQPYSKHYPLYSLNVASMWLKLGRLYMGLENKAAGEKALKKAIAIMEVAHGKDHPYISEIKHEIESH
nr:N-lysine methyltransferase SMYD2 [Loxodonta africana]